MTIVVATHRPGFAVVAADRRVTRVEWPDGERAETIRDGGSKLVIDADRPLAIASTGLAGLAELAAHLLAKHGLPVVLDALSAHVVRVAATMPDARGACPSDVVIAQPGQITVLELGPRPQIVRPRVGVVCEGPGLAGYYTASDSPWASVEARYGRPELDADQVAEHLRAVALSGLREESQRHPGLPADLGVDVAIVDHQGARLVAPTLAGV